MVAAGDPNIGRQIEAIESLRTYYDSLSGRQPAAIPPPDAQAAARRAIEAIEAIAKTVR
jgi:hypothetical protein